MCRSRSCPERGEVEDRDAVEWSGRLARGSTRRRVARRNVLCPRPVAHEERRPGLTEAGPVLDEDTTRAELFHLEHVAIVAELRDGNTKQSANLEAPTCTVQLCQWSN